MLITYQQKRQCCPEGENLEVVHLAPIRLSTESFEFASAMWVFLFYFDSQGLSVGFLVGDLRTIVGIGELKY